MIQNEIEIALTEVNTILDKDYPEMEKLFKIVRTKPREVARVLGLKSHNDAVGIITAWDAMEVSVKQVADSLKSTVDFAKKNPKTQFPDRRPLDKAPDYQRFESMAMAFNEKLANAGLIKKGKK